MAQSFFDTDSFYWVECKEFLEQVQGQIGGLGEEGLQGYLLFKREGSDIFPSTTRFDAIIVFHGWCPQDIQDEGKLMVIILAGEQRLPAQHFRQYATNTPHINSLGVLFEGQHDFRCTVPTSGHIFCHKPRVVVRGSGRTG
ncbi:hypothetical protein ACKS0A_06254 [Histoplasma ohiense]